MSALQLKTTDDFFLISVDRKALPQEQILRILELFRLEMLAHKVDIGPEIEGLGDEIADYWWKKNKDNYLSPER